MFLAEIYHSYLLALGRHNKRIPPGGDEDKVVLRDADGGAADHAELDLAGVGHVGLDECEVTPLRMIILIADGEKHCFLYLDHVEIWRVDLDTINFSHPNIHRVDRRIHLDNSHSEFV